VNGLVDNLIGHTPDDQPVRVRQWHTSWDNTVVTSIEHGHEVLALDHLDPELIGALCRSLTRTPRRHSA
jgi:hypothetical protein